MSAGSNNTTRSVFQRAAAALGQENCALSDIVETTVRLKDPRDVIGLNDSYKEFFNPPLPTRAILRADFMFDALVEVKASAYEPRV
ncbi:MAG: RidA family protein [Proteobacteria bacterium]|nr:RidA family protein [Pseudomonadota bacterium]